MHLAPRRLLDGPECHVERRHVVGDLGDLGDLGQLRNIGDLRDLGYAGVQGRHDRACGTSCTKCTVPTGGKVECVNGACQKSCVGTQTLCGDACVDTTSSPTHCGRCDHSCGAGQCEGACQPFPVATGFTAVHAIAVSPSGVIISADSDLSLCANPDGCTAATSRKTIRQA